MHLFVSLLKDTSSTSTYTLSLHDALPISTADRHFRNPPLRNLQCLDSTLNLINHHSTLDSTLNLINHHSTLEDRKSTRLNSSHVRISYAVFCLKKKTVCHN